MKILIVSQHYYPENFRITDIAETLAKLGYKVTVLCGLPNYPEGHIYPGYKSHRNWVQDYNGVHIIRSREIGRRHGIIFRVLNYWSFPFFANFKIKKIGHDFDIVLFNELSPIMMGKPAVKFAQKYHKPLLMYEMDLWPESILAGGIKKNSLIYKHYQKVSAKIYSKCDKILVSTKEHIDYIKALPHCDRLDIACLMQYAEAVFEHSSIDFIDNGVIDIMFAGNVGVAQNISVVIKAAALLNDNPRFKFHIVGNGSDLANAKNLAKKLKVNNVIFYGHKPIDEMPSLYKIADAMLVTLEDKPYANMTIPGKLQSYMASGKPVIGVINGSCNNYITDNKIGYATLSDDANGLANIIRSLELENLKQIGKNAREVYFKNLSKEKFISSLVEELNKLIK